MQNRKISLNENQHIQSNMLILWSVRELEFHLKLFEIEDIQLLA